MQVLDHLLSLGANPSLLKGIFANLVASWAQQGQATRCQQTFDKLLGQNIAPDPVTSRVVLRTIASSNRVDSAETVAVTMDRILASGARVDAFMLVSQLQAWAKNPSPAALAKAESALLRYVNYGYV